MQKMPSRLQSTIDHNPCLEICSSEHVAFRPPVCGCFLLLVVCRRCYQGHHPESFSTLQVASKTLQSCVLNAAVLENYSVTVGMRVAFLMQALAPCRRCNENSSLLETASRGAASDLLLVRSLDEPKCSILDA